MIDATGMTLFSGFDMEMVTGMAIDPGVTEARTLCFVLNVTVTQMMSSMFAMYFVRAVMFIGSRSLCNRLIRLQSRHFNVMIDTFSVKLSVEAVRPQWGQLTFVVSRKMTIVMNASSMGRSSGICSCWQMV